MHLKIYNYLIFLKYLKVEFFSPGFFYIDCLQFERVGNVKTLKVQHLNVVEVQLELLTILKLWLEDDVHNLQVFDGLKVDGDVG